MNTLTVDELDDITERMLPVATDLVCQVHDHQRGDAHDLLAGLRVVELRALAVVLAALVPADQPFADLVAWTHGPLVDPSTYATLAAFDPHPGMKLCLGCQEWRRKEEYNRSANSPDGLKPRCKACMAEARRERSAGEPADEEVAA